MAARTNPMTEQELLPPEEQRLRMPNESANWHPSRLSIWGRIANGRFFIAWLCLAVFGASLIWTVSWFRPQQAVRISLIGSGYGQNLSLPQNVFGKKTLADLAELARHNESGQSLLKLVHEPLTLKRDTNWAVGWGDSKEPNFVAYFAAHGGSDENGPYLFPNDARPDDPNGVIRIRSIFQRVKELPSETNKLVVFDTSSLSSSWNYGILSNQFTRSLKSLEKEIAEVPNLVVICSSDENQLARCSPYWQQSLFGHYFIEALAGAASDSNQDGRVDAEDVFKFVQQKVTTSAKQQFQALQRPILLPAGKHGMELASKIDLAKINRRYREADVVPPTLDTDQLVKVWHKHNQLRDATPAPYLYSPAKWRRYEKLILRYEELVQANDLPAANTTLEKIDSLAYQLEWDQSQMISSLQGNLFISAAVLKPRFNADSIEKTLGELWQAPKANREAVWQRTIANIKDVGQLSQFRIATLHRLYERAIADPANLLSKSAELAMIVVDPLSAPPAEVSFLRTLDRHLDEQAKSESNAELLRLALHVRARAEQAALVQQDGVTGNSENVVPWIHEMVAAGDKKRVLGQDLLFANSTHWDRSRKLLVEAESAYRAALSQGAAIRDAFELRSEVFYRIPHFIDWISQAAADTNVNEQSGRIDQFEKLIHHVHLLDQMLSDQDGNAMQIAVNHNVKSAEPSPLLARTKLTRRQFGSFVEQFEDWWNSQASSETPDTFPEIELALSVPFGQPEQRVALLNVKRQLAKSLAQTLVGHTHAEEVHDSSQTSEQLESEFNQCRIEGRMALALMGTELFELVRQPGEETFEQVQHRLNVFETEQEWWNSVALAGHSIRSAFHRLEHLIESSLSNPDKKGPGLSQLADSARINRIIGNCVCREKLLNPNLQLRNHLQSKLFSNLARRSHFGRWHGIDAIPHYEREAKGFLETATRLWPENPEITELEDALRGSLHPSLSTPDRLSVTTQDRLEFQVSIDCKDLSDFPTGYPVVWFPKGQDFKMERPTLGQKLVQTIESGQSPSAESCFLRSSSSPTSLLGQANQELKVNAFFRGRLYSNSILLQKHLRPKTALIGFRKPDAAMISVRASEKLHGALGQGSGGVAIVLDASGSMGSKLDQEFDASAKYYEATRALKQVLASLPDGISVSIWIFGQALGAQKTVRNAESTIRRIIEPTIWDSQDSGQLDAIMNTISYPNVEPWNESPIVRTVLAARQDLLGIKGYKSVLLITDGMDNRFGLFRNASGSSVPDALRRAFDQTDIALNVVGFKVEAREANASRAQFQVVESFSPPGKYFVVEDALRLAETLKSTLYQRIRYWVDDYSNLKLVSGRIKVDVSRSEGGNTWYPKKLRPGSYSLWTNVDSAPFNMLIRRGDQLVLELSRLGNKLVCQRTPYLSNKYSWKPGKRAAGWNVTAMQNRIADRQLELTIGFEREPSIQASSLELVRPYDIWFELGANGSTVESPALRWFETKMFPVPAWKVESGNWPNSSIENLPASPSMKVWWSPERPVTPDARYLQWRDFTSVFELVGRATDLQGDQVKIESIEIEERSVEISKGRFARKPCLLIRISHASDEQYLIRTKGVEFEGWQQLSFPSAGSATAIYWPAVASEIEEELSSIELVSVNELKRQAESQGCFLEFDDLGTPRPDDVAQPPLTGLSHR